MTEARLLADTAKPANIMLEMGAVESYRFRPITVGQMLILSFTGSCSVTLVHMKPNVNALKKWVWFCSILLFWARFYVIELHSVKIRAIYKFLRTVNHMTKYKLQAEIIPRCRPKLGVNNNLRLLIPVIVQWLAVNITV